MFPPQFVFSLLQTAIQTLSVAIAEELDIPVNDVQWLSHIENMILCSVAVVSNRIHARVGVPLCYIVGAWLITIGSLVLFFVYDSFHLIILFRGISALGFGIVIPATVPMTNFLVRKNEIEKSLSITGVVVPAAYIVATFAGSALAEYGSWEYIFLIGAAIGLVHAVGITVLLPIAKGNKNVHFDVVAFSLLISFTVCSILGCGLLSKKGSLVYTGIALIAISLVCVTCFFAWNRSARSKYKVIPLEVLNRNTITFLLSYLFVSIGVQADVFFQPILWQNVFGYSTLENGILIGICKVICLPFAVVYALVIKRVCVCYVAFFCSVVLIVCYVAQCLFLEYLLKTLAIESLNLVTSLFYLQNQVAIQVYNVVGSPKKYGPISSTYVGFIGKYAWSIGTAISTAVQAIASKDSASDNTKRYRDSVILAYISNIPFLLVSSMISLRIGIFDWERGRLGFSERKLLNFETYDELRMRDKTVVQTSFDSENECSDEEDLLIKRQETESLRTQSVQRWKWQFFGIPVI